MYLDEQKQKEFARCRFLAYALLVAAPIIYVIVTLVIRTKPIAGEEMTIVLFILLPLAMVQPLLAPLLQRFQMDMYHRQTDKKIPPEKLLTTVSIIKFSLVETSYIYGLIVYFLSGSFVNMIYFYIVGIAWTFVHWPRLIVFERFLERLDTR